MNDTIHKRIFLIAGARPNFMKITPIYRESQNFTGIECAIVHTGQHYDYEMSQAFFEDLNLPEPDYFLSAGSGSHAHQTAKIMTAFEDLCMKDRPDLVMVVGDVNSTMACSIVAKKMNIEVAHVEAGLRSFDLTMPEEINRIVTDSLSDYFFVTEKSGEENLIKEGKPHDRIHFVGHVMIDNLYHQLKELENNNTEKFSIYKLKQKYRDYAFLTIHRPSNVDDRECFEEIVGALNDIARDRPIFFPVHPRTRKMIKKHKITLSKNIIQLPPLPFKESLFLWKDAAVVLTDSGGLQEETTALKIPCLTLRDNTERPITIEIGSNVLAGVSGESIRKAYQITMQRNSDQYSIPPKWDGRAAKRIFKVILDSCDVSDPVKGAE